jgi:flagellar biosynthesis GTPase FlhF
LTNVNDYITARLDDQIKWYGEKSAFNKSRYRICQIIIIIAGGIIPLINLTATGDWWQHAALISSAILGSIITIITAFTQMEKYLETWILYRTTEESLRREKFLFINESGEYSNLIEVNRNRHLVEKVEALLSTESSKFFALQQQQQQQKQQQQTTTTTTTKQPQQQQQQKPQEQQQQQEEEPHEQQEQQQEQQKSQEQQQQPQQQQQEQQKSQEQQQQPQERDIL